MTDESILDQLDQRGRAAAAGLRAAVAERPAPAFDPEALRVDIDAPTPRAHRGRRIGLALAVAAALLVVVAAVAALGGGTADDRDDDPADRVGADELRRYLLGDVPEGLGLSDVTDQVGPTADAEGMTFLGPVAVVGPSVEEPAVAAIAMPTSDAPDVDDSGLYEELEVAGRRAWRQTLSSDSGVLVELGDRLVALYVGSTSTDDLGTVVDALTIAGESVTVDEGALPEGWAELGTVDFDDVVPSTVALRGGADVRLWAATYAAPGDEGETISVISRPGSVLEVGVTGLVTTEARQVTVRGHRAVLAPFPQPEIPGAPDDALSRWTSVTWEERPGEVVTVAGSVDEAELLAAAEGVVVVGAAEVEGLELSALRFGVSNEDAVVVGEGTFSDGSPWILVRDAGHSTGAGLLGLRTTVTSSGSSSGFGAAAGGVAGDVDPVPDEQQDGVREVAAERGEDFGWLYGELRPNVEAVEVRDGATGDVVAEGDVVEAAGIRAYVVEVPVSDWPDDGTPRWDVVGLDASGAEVGTLSLG